MNYYFWTAFTIGFLGSFHCVGMCGPLAIAIGSGIGGNKIYLKLLYNIGRIFTYSIMGTAAGFVGKSFSIMGLQNDLSIGAGIMIIIFILFSNGRLLKFFTGKTVKATAGMRGALGRMMKKKSPFAIFGVGLLNGILPCGFVYLSLAGATAAGTIYDSFLYMLLFGLGTLPMMFGLSIIGSLISIKTRSIVNQASPYLAVALAILLIWRGNQVKKESDCCKKPHISAIR